jgi:hypothetical protein
MNSTTTRFRCSVCGAVSAILFAAHSTATAVTFLENPGVYTATPSSTFSAGTAGDVDVTQLFDGDPNTTWAIDGFLGNNPQGRDQGWVSVSLNQDYKITDLLFDPRKPSGDTDGIDNAYIWVSQTPFNVSVTSDASTNAFLASPTGAAPTLTIGPFTTFTTNIDYPFGSTVDGQYILAEFVNTTDHDNDRNLGVRTLEIGQIGIVPEPPSMDLLAAGAASVFGVCAWKRRGKRRRMMSVSAY